MLKPRQHAQSRAPQFGRTVLIGAPAHQSLISYQVKHPIFFVKLISAVLTECAFYTLFTCLLREYRTFYNIIIDSVHAVDRYFASQMYYHSLMLAESAIWALNSDGL